MLDHEDRLRPLRPWLAGDAKAQSGDEAAALNSIKSTLSRARVTRFEIITGRVIIKSKKDDRRQALISERPFEMGHCTA